MSTAQQVVQVLESRYKARRIKPNEYQSVSPMRADASNPHSFTLTVEGDEHGAWHDFVTGSGGSLYELAAHLGIETPKGNGNGRGRGAVQLTKRPYEGLADYATAHGVTEDVFKAARWREDTIDGRPALVYPTGTGERIRFMDGQDPRYKSPAGYKICWYGLRNLLGIQHESGLPVIICNGEASTVVGQHYGLPVCATTGGEGSMSQALLDELLDLWNGDIVLAFDCDEAGKRAGEKVAGMLNERKRAVYVLDLQLSAGGDIADFCTLYADKSADELRARLKTLAPYEPPDATKQAVEGLAQAVGQLAQAVKVDAARSDLERTIAAAQERIDALSKRISRAPLMDTSAVLERLDEEIARTTFDGLSTSFPLLDEAIGGLKSSAVTYVLGASGMGKSTLSASMAAKQESIGLSALYICTEMRPDEYALKVLTALSGVPDHLIIGGRYRERDEAERVRIARAAIASNKSIYANTIHMSRAALRVAVLEAAARGVSCVVIDSISKLVNAGVYSDGLAMNNELLELARETGLPFLVTSQIDRDVGNRTDKTPRISDAYGGAFIEQGAHALLGAYRHDFYVNRGMAEPDDRFPQGTMSIIILKARRPFTGKDVEGQRIRCEWRAGAGVYPATFKTVNLGDIPDSEGEGDDITF